MSAFRALQPSTSEATLERITPIITVDAIEPCLPFWTQSLGCELTASVPDEGPLAFVILQQGQLEIMYQTQASIDEDLGASGAPEDLGNELGRSTATLFIQVEALDPVLAAIGEGALVVVPRRQTDYGMDEVFVRAPCGTLVGFAARMA